jgi:hypothetical protein
MFVTFQHFAGSTITYILGTTSRRHSHHREVAGCHFVPCESVEWTSCRYRIIPLSADEHTISSRRGSKWYGLPREVGCRAHLAQPTLGSGAAAGSTAPPHIPQLHAPDVVPLGVERPIMLHVMVGYITCRSRHTALGRTHTHKDPNPSLQQAAEVCNLTLYFNPAPASPFANPTHPTSRVQLWS